MKCLVMIHQPHFIPWPGYFARCLASSAVVFLDNVRFKKDYFHNRTKIVRRDGSVRWLTIPVDHTTRQLSINKVMISSAFKNRVINNILRDSYCSSPDFKDILAKIEQSLDSCRGSLASLNINLLRYIINNLTSDRCPPPEMYLASEFEHENDRTKRLITISQNLHCDGILMGEDSFRCHNIQALLDHGIVPYALNFDHDKGPIPPDSVTILHEVFKDSWDVVYNRLKNNWILTERINNYG